MAAFVYTVDDRKVWTRIPRDEFKTLTEETCVVLAQMMAEEHLQ